MLIWKRSFGAHLMTVSPTIITCQLRYARCRIIYVYVSIICDMNFEQRCFPRKEQTSHTNALRAVLAVVLPQVGWGLIEAQSYVRAGYSNGIIFRLDVAKTRCPAMQFVQFLHLSILQVKPSSSVSVKYTWCYRFWMIFNTGITYGLTLYTLTQRCSPLYLKLTTAFRDTREAS